MRALTLHRPWPWAIFHLDAARAKRVENRVWPPPAAIVGKFIAIHAGLGFDDRGADFIASVAGEPAPPELEHPTGIVGVARVVGVRRPGDAPTDEHGNDGWYMGRIGWLLEDVVVLAAPVPCRGVRRIWTVPRRVARLVRKQLPTEMRRCV